MDITFTSTVTGITMSSADLKCTVSGIESTQIASCGFQIHKGSGFGGEQMTDFFAENGEFFGAAPSGSTFTLSFTGCSPGNVLSVRPYLVADKKYFGEPFMVKIKTKDDYKPKVSSLNVSNVDMRSATFSAVVSAADPSYPVIEAGFVYKLKVSGIETIVKCIPDSNGKISANVNGLDMSTEYTVWAYAVSSVSRSFSSKQFNTYGYEALPSVSISDFVSVSDSGFKLTASVTSNHSSYTASEVGFVLKKNTSSGDMTLDNGNTTREVCSLSEGKFTLEKTNLAAGRYKVRAYLLSEGRDIYSKDSLEYSTDLSVCIPEVRMNEAVKGSVSVSDDKKKQISVSLSAQVGMTYGEKISAKGFLYQKDTPPESLTSVASKIEVIEGFASSVKLDIPDTGYADWYFVAYATNKNGTAFSAAKKVRVWWKDGI